MNNKKEESVFQDSIIKQVKASLQDKKKQKVLLQTYSKIEVTLRNIGWPNFYVPSTSHFERLLDVAASSNEDTALANASELYFRICVAQEKIKLLEDIKAKVEEIAHSTPQHTKKVKVETDKISSGQALGNAISRLNKASANIKDGVSAITSVYNALKDLMPVEYKAAGSSSFRNSGIKNKGPWGNFSGVAFPLSSKQVIADFSTQQGGLPALYGYMDLLNSIQSAMLNTEGRVTKNIESNFETEGGNDE